MAAKRKRRLSSESETSSALSSFSRSPTPPNSWSSPKPTAGEDNVANFPGLLAKRRKVANKPHPSPPRRTGRRTRRSPSTYQAWMDPKSEEWDILAVLDSDLCLADDPLLRRPTPNYTYIDSKGRLKDADKYIISKSENTHHPRLCVHIQNGTATHSIHKYYQDLPADVILPIAGIIHESQFQVLFKDHILTGIVNQEDGFHARPSIKLVIPDHLKAILVDDWENVTKNQQLVPLPSEHPVNTILADYLAFEQPKRIPGSAQADILEEVVAGLKEYFEKCLGRILLYRFERNQYLEIRELWNAGTGEWAGKTAGDAYGAEHLCRLLVSLPELIAQTNMDQQSVNRLREELLKMTNWLGKNATKYFVSEYETPSQNYIEKARGY